MKLYTGIYFCTESNWDSVYYQSRYHLSIEDDENVTTEEELFIKSEYESNKKYFGDLSEERQIRVATKDVMTLKPEVIQWLEENVADRPKSHDEYDECPKGWCIGSESYRAGDSGHEISLWFHRKKDVNKFIKVWSKEGLPIFTYNQDTYVKQVLVDGRLVNEDDLDEDENDGGDIVIEIR